MAKGTEEQTAIIDSKEYKELSAKLDETITAKEEAEKAKVVAEEALAKVEAEKIEAVNKLAESVKLVDTQAEEIKNLKGAKAPKSDKGVGTDVAEVALPKPKLIKVRFIKAHQFYFAHKNINAVAGSEYEVDKHVANKLVGRGIAVIF